MPEQKTDEEILKSAIDHALKQYRRCITRDMKDFWLTQADHLAGELIKIQK